MAKRSALFAHVLYRKRTAEHNYGAIVHAVIESRTCEHKPIENEHRHTNGNARFERVHHSTRLRSVNDEPIAYPCITGRDDERFAVDNKANVTNECFVQELFNDFLDCNLELRISQRQLESEIIKRTSQNPLTSI